MNFMQKTLTWITLFVTLASCSSGKKNYFQDTDGLNSEPSSYIYPSTSSHKRKPSSVEENIFKLFSEHFSEIVRSVRKEAAPSFELIDRSVARTVRERFPSLMEKEYKNTSELFEDIKKLKTSKDLQADALARSIKSLSHEFGVEASASLTALRQTYTEAGLKTLATDMKGIARFDVKNTESTAGTFLNDLREKSSDGEVYTFVIGGKPNELIKAKDTHGNTIFEEAKKMVSTSGALSMYNYAIIFRRSEIEFMNVETKKEFSNFLRAYKGNHPEFHFSIDPEVFRTQGDAKQRMIVLDAFINHEMPKGKRIAVRMDDAHLYLGDPQKGGSLDHDVMDKVLKWKNENPASLDNDGKAHFTNLIMTDEISKLHPDITTDQAVAVVPFPLASDDDIIEFVEQLMKDPANSNALEKGYSLQEFAGNATGLQLREIKIMINKAAKSGNPITSNDVLNKAKEAIEKMFLKYADSEGKPFLEVRIVTADDIAERMGSIEIANESQLGFIDKSLDFRFQKDGKLAFDTEGSKGIMLIGGKGSGKSTTALHIAKKRKAILITFTKYRGIYADSAVGIAADVKNITKTLRNVVFFFDEFETIPSTITAKTANPDHTASTNAAAGIWKIIFAETDLKKTGSIFLGATANPQMLGTEILRPGRFNPVIPLSYLTEVPQRRKAIDQLLEKYRANVGDVKSDIFSDEIVNRMPVMSMSEMDELLSAAISEKSGTGPLTAEHMEKALEKKIFARTDLNSFLDTEYNSIFYTSKEAQDLRPEYVKKMDPAEIAKAKTAYQMYNIKPDWEIPTWMTGSGKKQKPVEAPAPKKKRN